MWCGAKKNISHRRPRQRSCSASLGPCNKLKQYRRDTSPSNRDGLPPLERVLFRALSPLVADSTAAKKRCYFRCVPITALPHIGPRNYQVCLNSPSTTFTNHRLSYESSPPLIHRNSFRPIDSIYGTRPRPRSTSALFSLVVHVGRHRLDVDHIFLVCSSVLLPCHLYIRDYHSTTTTTVVSAMCLCFNQ